MLKSRMKRQAIEQTRAATQVTQIQAAIVALAEEDLLDLADIFAREPASPLKEMATAEMARRKLSL